MERSINLRIFIFTFSCQRTPQRLSLSDLVASVFVIQTEFKKELILIRIDHFWSKNQFVCEFWLDRCMILDLCHQLRLWEQFTCSVFSLLFCFFQLSESLLQQNNWRTWNSRIVVRPSHEGVGASFRGGIEPSKLVHATTKKGGLFFSLVMTLWGVEMCRYRKKMASIWHFVYWIFTHDVEREPNGRLRNKVQRRKC